MTGSDDPTGPDASWSGRRDGDPSFDPSMLARRAADVVAMLAGRAARLVAWWFLIAAFVVIGAYVAGLAVLDGGLRTVWFAVGLLVCWVVVVGLGRLWWNLVTIRRHSGDLVGELGRLVGQDPASERLVVDAVEVGEAGQDRSVMVFSQQFAGLGPTIGADRASYRWTDRVVSTMRSGFVTVAKSVVFTGLFAVLGLVFLLALAL